MILVVRRLGVVTLRLSIKTTCFQPRNDGLSTNRSYFVRHLSRKEAATEAIRLATHFLATLKSDRWELSIEDASPCLFEQRFIGKTPSKWNVITRCKLLDSPDSVIDGGDPIIVVDLLNETASFVE